jgi:hypothetical protein
VEENKKESNKAINIFEGRQGRDRAISFNHKKEFEASIPTQDGDVNGDFLDGTLLGNINLNDSKCRSSPDRVHCSGGYGIVMHTGTPFTESCTEICTLFPTFQKDMYKWGACGGEGTLLPYRSDSKKEPEQQTRVYHSGSKVSPNGRLESFCPTGRLVESTGVRTVDSSLPPDW